MTPPPPPPPAAAAVVSPPSAFDRRLALEFCTAVMLPFRTPPKMLPRPGVSYDGRSPTSTYWGVSTKMVKMCPHVRPGGGQCGLTADLCICTCLLCGRLMEARKRCGRRLPDGSICPWGQDRSPEVSSPEQDPAPPPKRKRLHWRHAAYAMMDQWSRNHYLRRG